MRSRITGTRCTSASKSPKLPELALGPSQLIVTRPRRRERRNLDYPPPRLTAQLQLQVGWRRQLLLLVHRFLPLLLLFLLPRLPLLYQQAQPRLQLPRKNRHRCVRGSGPGRNSGASSSSGACTCSCRLKAIAHSQHSPRMCHKLSGNIQHCPRQHRSWIVLTSVCRRPRPSAPAWVCCHFHHVPPCRRA